MAWIEAHQKIVNHPKTLALASAMGWSVDETIGKLMRFWWWCVDYAESGDLRKFNNAILGSAVALNGADAEKFVKAMIAACWLDREPFFRVHDWWDYIGPFLRTKYKKHPHKWKAVQALYKPPEGSPDKAPSPAPGAGEGVGEGVATGHLTKPNQTNTPLTPQGGQAGGEDGKTEGGGNAIDPPGESPPGMPGIEDAGGTGPAEADSSGDDIDVRVRAFFAGHPMLLWNLKDHGLCRKLAQAVGFDELPNRVNEAIEAGKNFPIAWALGKCSREELTKAAAQKPPGKSALQRQKEWTPEY